MRTDRRGFLAVLAALPIVGRLFVSDDAKPKFPGYSTEGFYVNYYWYDEKTGRTVPIEEMTTEQVREWQHRQQGRRHVR